MYLAVRKYHVNADSMDEVERRVDEEFLPIIGSAKGFISYYAFNVGDGILVSVSVFLTKEDADASTQMAAKWIAESGEGLFPNPPKVTAGEVFSHGGS
jgi:hypothetical protein